MKLIKTTATAVADTIEFTAATIANTASYVNAVIVKEIIEEHHDIMNIDERGIARIDPAKVQALMAAKQQPAKAKTK